MNYELAKELKEAGYSQYHRYGRIHVRKGDVDVYYPTLSELIEACGLNFALQGEKDKWVAQRYGKPDERLSSEGSTPEEAVAKLYISLKKNG